jgi:protoporphyrinogen oxidase
MTHYPIAIIGAGLAGLTAGDELAKRGIRSIVLEKANLVGGIAIEQNGQTQQIEADRFISTMPVTALLQRLDPPPPPEVLAAATGLKYRDFLNCRVDCRSQ